MDNITVWFENLRAEFVLNFIKDDRWLYLTKGLGLTLLITVFSTLLGIFIGLVVATVRSTFDLNSENMKRHNPFSYYLLMILNKICSIYLTVIRGTPVVVQLMIDYFIIFAFSTNATLIAIFAFGVNSGAYVAEIVRGGIMSVDRGQFEAGRSLGFNYIQTMIFIIIPQMFKIVLPSLLNEFIALLKETSIAGYIGITDLTKAGDIIRGSTFSAFMPLFAVAGVYLALVMILSKLSGIIERRMRKSDR